MHDAKESADYYRRREAEARQLAAQVRSANIRQMHLELADHYKALAESKR